jgi:hypothetical protein
MKQTPDPEQMSEQAEEFPFMQLLSWVALKIISG